MTATPAAVRAETTKLVGLRSAYVPLVLFTLVSVLISGLAGFSARNALDSDSPMLRSDFTPEQAGFDGILYGQLALIVFAVIAVSAEYGSGMMQVSSLAVPCRGRQYAVKVLVTTGAALLLAVPSVPIAYLVTQAALGPYGVGLDKNGVLQAMGGGVVYVTLMSAFATGIAFVARSAVVPLAVLLPMILAGTQILSLIGVTEDLVDYFPDRAGTELLTVASDQAVTGLLVLLCWTAAALVLGYVRHVRWDG